MRKLWLGVACCGVAGCMLLLNGCSDTNNVEANSPRRLPPDVVKPEEIQRRQTTGLVPAAKEEEAAGGRRPPDIKK